MYERRELIWLYGLTSAHVGSGDNLSYVDLPIQRETHTGFPKIEASSLKGAIRHHIDAKLKDEKTVKTIFGAAGGEDDGASSEMAISDARVLFFPVKSAKGIFAWVTCPMVIKRFEQDCQIVDKDIKSPFKDLKENDVVVFKSSKLLINDSQIMLEELVFEPNQAKASQLDTWIKSIVENYPFLNELELNDFKSRVIIISDDDFKYFVTQATEVITRIAIDSGTGVVKSDAGALFTEEYLPPESILYSLLFLKNDKKDDVDIKKTLNDYLDNKIVQIGGNATLGKGLFRFKLKKKEGVESDESKNK